MAQALYWETCGHPQGQPALVLHGGPGSGCSLQARRMFDPRRYRIVLFDQRQCGRSRPRASSLDTDLSVNTTDHLIADIERLRVHLSIDRWLVLGGSWGCALALLYAQRFRERVSALVVTGVATARRAETELLTRGLGRLFPAAWQRFRDGVPSHAHDGDLAGAYLRLLRDPDASVRARAARAWCDWEIASQPDAPPHPRYLDSEFRLVFATIVAHYFGHGSWLPEDHVLHNASALAGIPGVIVQGTLDLGNLLGTPWQLAAAWQSSELVLVDAGHTSTMSTADALVRATDRFARE
jgi:proline iminopeptidase